MISNAIRQSIENSSWIRKMFEEGAKLKQKYGEDKVFDLSLGNPVFEPPKEFFDALSQLAKNPEKGKHRYMSNSGFLETRAFVADSLKEETQLFLKLNVRGFLMASACGKVD